MLLILSNINLTILLKTRIFLHKFTFIFRKVKKSYLLEQQKKIITREMHKTDTCNMEVRLCVFICVSGHECPMTQYTVG